jgi:hypothetical protein
MTNLETLMQAIKKTLDERDKLLKQFKAAKNPEEKKKLQAMAEGARKIALAHYEMVDTAKAKDKTAMLNSFKEMGLN